jgi:hypothetical protein
MKQAVDDTLAAQNLIIGNPMWAPREKKPLLSVDVYSHDISNKKFKVNVEGVFEAFRR